MIDNDLVKAIEKAASIATPIFTKENWTWGKSTAPTQYAIESHLLGLCIDFVKNKKTTAVECGHLRIEKDDDGSLTFYLDLGTYYPHSEGVTKEA